MRVQQYSAALGVEKEDSHNHTFTPTTQQQQNGFSFFPRTSSTSLPLPYPRNQRGYLISSFFDEVQFATEPSTESSLLTVVVSLLIAFFPRTSSTSLPPPLDDPRNQRIYLISSFFDEVQFATEPSTESLLTPHSLFSTHFVNVISPSIGRSKKPALPPPRRRLCSTSSRASKTPAHLNISWTTESEEMRDQELCNCCWAMGIAGVVESQYNATKKKSGQKITISAQDLINHFLTNAQIKQLNEDPKSVSHLGISGFDEKGCYGVPVKSALEWVKKNGCVTEEKCPFVGLRGSKAIDRQPMFKFQTLIHVASDEIWGMIEKHPILADIVPTPEFTYLERDSIYRGPKKSSDIKNKKPTHVVLVVGRAKEMIENEVEEYYIVKNSWGKSWANDGYGRISRKPYIIKEKEERKGNSKAYSLLSNGWITNGVYML
ncbi:hypothetical protein PIB30_004605 [Stylosanthes scabra]|uniref:Peptidase C1A papain C-terminal domain-containing protein n=1 Tax=Stylosanthes scabra TaxID=79078 RepID=A0ABU6Z3G5_9FABA|nr:hypothetical protein [Stylosanthes scabra]